MLLLIWFKFYRWAGKEARGTDLEWFLTWHRSCSALKSTVLNLCWVHVPCSCLQFCWPLSSNMLLGSSNSWPHLALKDTCLSLTYRGYKSPFFPALASQMESSPVLRWKDICQDTDSLHLSDVQAQFSWDVSLRQRLQSASKDGCNFLGDLSCV